MEATIIPEMQPLRTVKNSNAYAENISAASTAIIIPWIWDQDMKVSCLGPNVYMAT